MNSGKSHTAGITGVGMDFPARRLTNADLRYSNFYAVEFMNATVGGTDFSGANLDLTKLEDWSPPK